MSNPSSPTGAVNVGHSQLLQSPTSVQGVAHTEKQKDLLEARRKFNSCLESDVLDYLHYHPSQLVDCVTTLHRLFSNIVEHPDDQKYRRVSRATTSAFLGLWPVAAGWFQTCRHYSAYTTCLVQFIVMLFLRYGRTPSARINNQYPAPCRSCTLNRL